MAHIKFREEILLKGGKMSETAANGEIKTTEIEDTESAQISSSPIPAVGLSLRLNFSWTLLGNVVSSICQWGMLVMLAKLGTPEKVGRLALGYAITAPVMMFANLHLRTILTTDTKGEHPFANYLGLRTMTTALAFAVIIGIALFSRYNPETSLVILAIGMTKAFESVSDIYYGLLQHHERMDRIAISSMIKGTLSLAVFCITFYLTKSVFLGSLGTVVVLGLMLLLFDVNSARLIARAIQQRKQDGCAQVVEIELRPSWHAKPLYNLAVVAFPMGIVMLLISLNVNIPRYFIERYMGERDLGIFAAMTYLMIAGTIVISALAQSAIPRLSKHYAAGEKHEFTRLLMKLTAMGALIGVLCIGVVAAAGGWILNMLYGPEYAVHKNVFLWIAVASAVSFVQWFLGDGITAARYFRIQPVLLTVVTVITTLACLWLVPAYGLIGAAYALVIANVILLLGILCVNIHAVARLGKNCQ